MLSEKPWKPIDTLVVMAVLAVIFLLGVVVSTIGQRAEAVETAIDPGVNFIFYVIFCGVIWALVHLMVRARGASWRTAFGFNAPRQMSALLTALGVTMIVFPIAVFLRWISADLMQRIGRQPAPQQSVQMLQTTVALAPQIYLAIQAIVFAPITEELLFRGILYPSIKQQGYPKLALVITSVLFGGLHLNLMLFVPLTFLGLMLGWLYEKTDNLGASIFAHSLFNLANYVWAVSGKQTT